VNLAGAEFAPPYDTVDGHRTSNPDPGVFGTNYTNPTHVEIDYYAAMPEMQTPGFLPCAHCGGTGTCRNGNAGDSCAVCIKKNRIEGETSTGLVCSVCRGYGAVEPRTARLRNLIAPVFALLIV